MASIVIHRSALADLDSIWDAAPAAAAAIVALLQEAKENQAVLDSFSSQDFGADETKPYNVQRWAAQQDQGRNLWRLKLWELERDGSKYRVLYAFNPKQHRYYVLGVLPREFNYDESDPRTKQILEVYDRLEIPEYR